MNGRNAGNKFLRKFAAIVAYIKFFTIIATRAKISFGLLAVCPCGLAAFENYGFFCGAAVISNSKTCLPPRNTSRKCKSFIYCNLPFLWHKFSKSGKNHCGKLNNANAVNGFCVPKVPGAAGDKS